MVNDPLAGTADLTNTVELCWEVARTMLAVVTPESVIVFEEAPAEIVVVPLRLNLALPVTLSARAPLEPAASIPAPPEDVA